MVDDNAHADDKRLTAKQLKKAVWGVLSDKPDFEWMTGTRSNYMVMHAEHNSVTESAFKAGEFIVAWDASDLHKLFNVDVTYAGRPPTKKLAHFALALKATKPACDENSASKAGNKEDRKDSAAWSHACTESQPAAAAAHGLYCVASWLPAHPRHVQKRVRRRCRRWSQCE